MKMLLALAALLGMPGAVHSQVPPHSNIRVVIRTADLDLANAHDRARLDRRIGRIVADACGTPSASDLAGQNEVRRCRVLAKDRASLQRDAAIATALARHAGETALATER